MDALDRGVIDAGLTAAEALSRVKALAAEVAELREQFAAVYRLGLEHGERRAVPKRLSGTRDAGQPRHLRSV
jgi:hypothetical protein